MRSDHLTYSVVRPSELASDDIEAWSGFQSSNKALQSSFYSHSYALATERAGFAAEVVVARTGHGAPVGYLLLQKYSGLGQRVGLGQRLAGGMTDYFGLVAPSDSEFDLDGFLRAAKIGSFQINHMFQRQSGPGETLLSDEGSPCTFMPQGFEQWWEDHEEQSKSRANDLKRRRRKLERDVGAISFEFSCADMKAKIANIIELKSVQYLQRDTADIFALPRNRELLFELAKSEDPLCELVVSELRAGDTWAASHIGLRCGSTLHYWFPVYNDEIKRTSPGRILILELLRAAADAGVTRIDYGLGESRTKMEFANEVVPLVKGQWESGGLRSIAARLYQRHVRQNMKK